VNWTIANAFLRQRATSPMRVALLFIALGPPLLFATAAPGMGFIGVGDPFFIVWILGAGMIGQDVSSGVLHLTFARPVRRSEYVFTKWLTLGAAATVLVLVQILIAAGAQASHGMLEPLALSKVVSECVLKSFGLAATVALCSSLLTGLGDAALVALTTISTTVMQFVGDHWNWPVIVTIGRELFRLANPSVEMPAALTFATVPWQGIAQLASNAAIALAVAVVVMNRKELSYASG